MQTLAARERSAGGRVSVRTYFAAKDALVGGRGKKAVDYVSTTVDGTDHDTLVQSVEVWEEIFSSVR
ncbi:hypothetical protein Aspvir_005828 [Aspergillus viridinutans]|uniref:Uncharacterized protein n=1 Tax=Aspergillus viridinutans TaxID=75553 RepID=A0A9P3BY34_ASPVI|nr:uncharacterized protein Aspvir_005828 [Aspergillus viridinutans]GIK01787.1 hypothetical protein Aspvir_005828 [Aspergillus viridinutans]